MYYNTYRSQTCENNISRRHYWQHLNGYNNNFQVQYKRHVEMHIADFLSITLSEKQKQQQDASTSQADDMDIFAIEDMHHVDAGKFTRVTDQQFGQI